MMDWQLENNRLEQSFKASKPLFSDAEAKFEADRCLYCADAPCTKACPTEIDVPGFIRQIAAGDNRGAAQTILTQNMLGESCGSVCPVEELCVGRCVYQKWDKPAIQIGRLQRYATRDAKRQSRPLFKVSAKLDRKVALVGAGPASLACAAHLRQGGVECHLFDRHPYPGGLNTDGVAPYKWQAEEAIDEAQWILNMGVQWHGDHVLGQNLKGANLIQGYDAVFLGMGLSSDRRTEVADGGPGIWGATALIREIKLKPSLPFPTKPQQAVIVGGGNTAIDIARQLKGLGIANVTLAYRSSEEKMSGYRHEWQAAHKEGVFLRTNTVVNQVVRHGEAIIAIKITDQDGPSALPCDLLVFATGQSKHDFLTNEFDGLVMNGNGTVKINQDTCQTSLPSVYAGGDIVNGGMEVVNAARDGREAARHMLSLWQ